ncbi:MAG: NUDIX hydrolase [Alphaproteobacteria bacterium]
MQHQDAQFYVSIKGVIIIDGKVLLLRKISGAWDLPGGRLSVDEAPKQCLIREIQEETGLNVSPGRLLHRWVRRRPDKVDVFLVSHLCSLTGPVPEPLISGEHEEYGWFSPLDVAMLITSRGMRKSVQRAFRSLK